jgi:phage terminase large subunit GpA-like protein
MDPGDRRKALKNFYNRHRAEPWMEIEATRHENELLHLIDDRPDGIVPGHGQAASLTFGADTQDSGFYFTIYAIGYGRTMNMWLVRAGFVEDFDGLEQVLFDDQYLDADGQRYHVQFGLIDAKGHRTSEVYDWCTRFPGLIMPSVCEQQMRQPYNFSDVEFYPGVEKRKFPGNLKRARVDTTYYKNKLDGKLKVGKADPGAIRFPVNVSEIPGNFTAQLCAEARDEYGHWQQIGNRPNHYLDCTALTMVAADIKGIRFWSNPNDTEAGGEQKTNPARIPKTQKRTRW